MKSFWIFLSLLTFLLCLDFLMLTVNSVSCCERDLERVKMELQYPWSYAPYGYGKQRTAEDKKELIARFERAGKKNGEDLEYFNNLSYYSFFTALILFISLLILVQNPFKYNFSTLKFGVLLLIFYWLLIILKGFMYNIYSSHYKLQCIEVQDYFLMSTAYLLLFSPVVTIISLITANRSGKKLMVYKIILVLLFIISCIIAFFSLFGISIQHDPNFLRFGA